MRRQLLEVLVERCLLVDRVAVDGPDAAGKTTLADELAALLPARERDAVRVSIDEFLRPPAERYRLGRDAPEGYYRDSFDLEAFREAVVSAAAPVIADGVFLLRPELLDLWQLRIYTGCETGEILRRAAVRDPTFDESLYRTRYLPAHDAYRVRVRPHALADVVLDNTDPAEPRIVRT